MCTRAINPKKFERVRNDQAQPANGPRQNPKNDDKERGGEVAPAAFFLFWQRRIAMCEGINSAIAPRVLTPTMIQ